MDLAAREEEIQYGRAQLQKALKIDEQRQGLAVPTWPRFRAGYLRAVAATAPACNDDLEVARVQRALLSLRARLASKELSGAQFSAYVMMVKQGKEEPPVRAVALVAAASLGT